MLLLFVVVVVAAAFVINDVAFVVVDPRNLSLKSGKKRSSER